jgi:hypothetical protein
MTAPSLTWTQSRQTIAGLQQSHLGDRLGVAGRADVPELVDLIRCRGQPA